MWPLEKYLRVHIKKLHQKEGCTVMLSDSRLDIEWPVVLNPQETRIGCLHEEGKASLYVTTQRFIYNAHDHEWISIYFDSILGSTWKQAEETIQWKKDSYPPLTDQEFRQIKEGMVACAIIEERDGTIHLFDQEIRRNLPRLVEGIQKRLNNVET